MASRTLLATAALLTAVGLPAAWGQTSPASTATQTIDTMNTLWGRHPFARANHAKGVVTEGSFTPTADAATLSKANIFAGPVIPVVVRFSDSTGIPNIMDGSAQASPHGMSIKFRPAGAPPVDVVTNSLAFFPVATGEEFAELLKDISESPPDAPKPTKADQFIAAHPAVPKAFGSTTTPSSFAREVYNGVDAFIFVSADGKRQPFRFRIVPFEGAEHVDAAASKAMTPDFLVDELPQRLAKGPVKFHLMAQLANPGDQTKDPTQPWPDDRKLVDMGTITIAKAVADNTQAQKDLRYLPNNLTPGIEVSDDPLIDARVRAYVISFGRRLQ